MDELLRDLERLEDAGRLRSRDRIWRQLESDEIAIWLDGDARLT